MRYRIFDVDNARRLCDELNETYACSFEYHRTMSSYRPLKAVIPEEERGKTAFFDPESKSLYVSNRFGVQVAHPGNVIYLTHADGPIVYEPGEFWKEDWE